MNQRQPLDTFRLLIDAAEKILDMQHGEGYAAAHPDKVEAFIEDVAMSLWAAQLDKLAESLDLMP